MYIYIVPRNGEVQPELQPFAYMVQDLSCISLTLYLKIIGNRVLF